MAAGRISGISGTFTNIRASVRSAIEAVSAGRLGQTAKAIFTPVIAPPFIQMVKVDAMTVHPLEKEVKRLGVELQQARNRIEELEAQAGIDILTGIYNRGFGMTSLENRVNEAKRYGKPLSLIMFDVDLFKNVNDTYGHPAGDKVIAAVAKIIKDALRSADIPFRYGGEEFTVILPETTSAEAKIVAERIRRTIAKHLMLTVENKEIRVTISGGIASFEKDIDVNSENFLKRTDDALLQAKRSGRDRIITAERLAA